MSIGGEPACYIVEKHLNRFVEGQDVRNVERIFDQMWRATMPYGRKGLTIQAISAVDLALWDLLGKLRGEPVYALLGGKTKDRLPVYATTARPDLAKQMGFVASKFPCEYGPADGDEGLRKNLETARRHREVGRPGFPADDRLLHGPVVPYAIKYAKALAPYNIRWIEEFLPPDDIDGYVQVKQAVGGAMLLTTGEHEYMRYGFRELIARKAVDILQPDINWVGGVTEARRIVAMAAAYDIPVIPHGSSVFSYHLQYAFTNCPMAEFLIMSPKADAIVPLFGDLFVHEPVPKDGWIDIPDTPGWGVELNRGAEAEAAIRPGAQALLRTAEFAVARQLSVFLTCPGTETDEHRALAREQSCHRHRRRARHRPGHRRTPGARRCPRRRGRSRLRHAEA